MSDPFSDIDQEVTLDKLKKFFYKFKKIILISAIGIVILVSFIFYTNHNKVNKDIRFSGYLIEIINIIDQDEEKAVKELEKLSKLDHTGHQVLSNFLLSKIYLKRQDFSAALKHLEKIEINNKELASLNKLKNYFMSVAYLGLNKKDEFLKQINLLLAYGDYWSLLAHELRGHFLYSEGNLEASTKDFNKILNEQLSTVSMRERALEMINTIKMRDEGNF